MKHIPLFSRGLIALGLVLATGGAAAVSAVNPFGVNVSASAPTTVFLTFQALDPGERAVDAFWCGELQPALMAANPNLQQPVPVQSSDPCLPGTVYGRLPLRLDRSRASGSPGASNLTDIMSIPSSVARRALQDARAGLNSAFFYVRRFSGGAGGDRWVVVTCRLAGGGARTPLALTEVRLAWQTPGTQPPVLVLGHGQQPPGLAARIRYNGSGVLRGRWEIVQPGDPEPGPDDLLSEATLPPEQRALRRRWTLIERFERQLMPTGETLLPGPDPARLPLALDGAYRLLLRIEASDDREASSDTGGGRIAIAGGAAGFAMPSLRLLVVGAAPAAQRAPVLLAPAAEAMADGDMPVFTWSDGPVAVLLRWEMEPAEGGAEVLSALVRPGVGRYALPRWVAQAQRGRALRWRVAALDAQGGIVVSSGWRAVTLP